MPLFLRYQAVDLTLDGERFGEDFGQLVERLDTTDLHADIGEALLISTDDRFEAEVAPDGTPWAPVSPATLASAYTSGNRGRTRKRKTSKGRGDRERDTTGFERFKARKKILQELGIRGGLRGDVAYEAGDGYVHVGTSKVYGRAHQYGLGARSSMGGRGFAELPARPFIGISDEDEAVIGDIVARWTRDRLGG